MRATSLFAMGFANPVWYEIPEPAVTSAKVVVATGAGGAAAVTVAPGLELPEPPPPQLVTSNKLTVTPKKSVLINSAPSNAKRLLSIRCLMVQQHRQIVEPQC